jgi:hypothetical protein
MYATNKLMNEAQLTNDCENIEFRSSMVIGDKNIPDLK